MQTLIPRRSLETLLLVLGLGLALAGRALAQRQMEPLGRGLVALRQEGAAVYLSWRLLGTDPDEVAFNVYRRMGSEEPVKLNPEPLREATNFLDRGASTSEPLSYFVRPVLASGETAPSAPFVLPANAPARGYLSIPLQTLPGHTPNDASVGDLDGDGDYEIVLKQEMRPRDNARPGRTGETKLEAYTLEGAFLWRINLGKNIREGAHYTQFLVYDLDGDGRSEVVCKTADGTVDGQGNVVGDARADHRNDQGYVLEGPEYLTVFEGMTGRALATTGYLPPRGKVAAWGDPVGNRVDRFLAAIAYVDGARPSVVMCRGYYTRTVLVAWNWRDGRWTRAWTFDSDDGPPRNREYRGQGNHNLSVGDIDGDGKDEIVYGACAIDDDGKGLYSTGLGHGDAIHLSDIDPDRPGLEIFDIHERPRHPYGAELRDARTGALIWGKPSADVGRGVAMDLDPRSRGYELWASGPGLSGLWNVKGETISAGKPRSCNFGVWWDGDLLREVLDGNQITKWDWRNSSESLLLKAEDCRANNSSKSTPCLCADILGDWREEVLWRTDDNQELRLYVSAIPTDRRLPTLMHDPGYRLSVAAQNVGYNQPTQTGFYLGEGMSPPPRVAISTGTTPVKPARSEKPRIVILGDSTVSNYPQRSKLRGWGQMIGEGFIDGVTVVNLAVSGRSTKTFIAEGRLEKALREKADFALIQFGHNDSHQKGNPESTDARTDYKDYLRTYADALRKSGTEPIFITPMHRRIFRDGKLTSELKPYADAMAEVAREKGVPLVDLHAASGALFESLGDAGSTDLNVSPTDRTHFSEKGARAMARLVLEGLKQVRPELARLIRP